MSETECLLKSLGKAVIRATIIHENTEDADVTNRDVTDEISNVPDYRE